jgi:23S rRNA (adenine-N6)-dimethyltransferase
VAHQRQHHRHSIAPARRPELSQHFIRDPATARLIVDRLRISRSIPVLEPGSGRGIITDALADRGYHVIAVEKDIALHRALRSRMLGRTNIECHHADVLAFPFPREPYAVVSNVPFGITAALIRRLLDAPNPPEQALLVVQHEAAERFTGRPAETRVSLLHKPWFDLQVTHCFDRDDFTPPPSVECVLLEITRRERPLIPTALAPSYRRFILDAFGARRQEARDALRLLFTERQLVRFARDYNFARHARPSEIPFEAWLAMFRFHTHGRLASGEQTTADVALA